MTTMQPPKGRILYVEDHDDTRILMTIMLERAGFEVTPASNGRDCLALAQSGQHFDLYLLNHTFPDASGVTICEALRDLDADTPIIFYSGRAMAREKEAALKAGAQDYLIKPQDLFNVAEHVARWIEAKRNPQNPR
ncbi:MAG TPA: response regulator [Pyrinomonadaceae bacterium]|jgi:CheY-like chemotaxis protein